MTALDLSVDPPPTRDLPQDLRVHGGIHAEQGETVTYGLEAGNDQEIEMKLPPPMTRTLEAGAHSTHTSWCSPAT